MLATVADWQAPRVFAQTRYELLTWLSDANQIDLPKVCVDASHIRPKKGGEPAGASPVDLPGPAVSTT